jgi:hypothetical protein
MKGVKEEKFFWKKRKSFDRMMLDLLAFTYRHPSQPCHPAT